MYADATGPRGDIYPKGSWVAHTLRKLIGDDAFFRSLRTLVYGRPDPRPGNFTPQFGTTQGFLKIVNSVTGKARIGTSTSICIARHFPRSWRRVRTAS